MGADGKKRWFTYAATDFLNSTLKALSEKPLS
jgi:hypothetical protein